MSPSPMLIFLLIASPFIGSFLAVVLDRWPRGEGFIAGRSRCRACGTTLRAIDMLPLFSAILLKGRCRTCGASYGWMSFMMEAGSLGIALSAVLLVPPPSAYAGIGLGWGLVLLMALDAKHYWLPDTLTLGVAAAGLGWMAFIAPDLLPYHVAAGSGAYLALWLIATLYKYLRGRDGLGMGDAKLLMAAGFWCGPLWLGPIVLMASGSALIIVLLGPIRGSKIQGDMMVPLGAYLCPAFFLAWLAQNSEKIRAFIAFVY